MLIPKTLENSSSARWSCGVSSINHHHHTALTGFIVHNKLVSRNTTSDKGPSEIGMTSLKGHLLQPHANTILFLFDVQDRDNLSIYKGQNRWPHNVPCSEDSTVLCLSCDWKAFPSCSSQPHWLIVAASRCTASKSQVHFQPSAYMYIQRGLHTWSECVNVWVVYHLANLCWSYKKNDVVD